MGVLFHLTLARRVVNTEARMVRLGGGHGSRHAAQFAHGRAGRRRLLEVHQRRTRRAVHAHRRGAAAPRHRGQHLPHAFHTLF